jgi:hypothetical protein
MFALLLTILWEILEQIVVENDKLYYLTKKYWIVPEKYWNERIENIFFDVIANMCGYYFGSLYKSKYPHSTIF